jgi:hypothetical protein
MAFVTKVKCLDLTDLWIVSYRIISYVDCLNEFLMFKVERETTYVCNKYKIYLLLLFYSFLFCFRQIHDDSTRIVLQLNVTIPRNER